MFKTTLTTSSSTKKSMRVDGKYKTRSSQRWKKVQVQDRRSYGKVDKPSSYLDETDIRKGIDNQGHDFVIVNSKGEGRRRAEQGNDTVMANSQGKGTGRDERGHDIVVVNSEGEGAMNEAMTLLSSTPRARVRGVLSKARTSTWV